MARSAHDQVHRSDRLRQEERTLLRRSRICEILPNVDGDRQQLTLGKISFFNKKRSFQSEWAKAHPIIAIARLPAKSSGTLPLPTGCPVLR